MQLKTVKRMLRVNHRYMWQLANACGISRDSIYKYGHNDFKGHEALIHSGLRKLIGGSKSCK